MKGAFVRLRWQLTLSHLIAIVCTLVCLIAAVVVIAAVWMGTNWVGAPAAPGRAGGRRGDPQPGRASTRSTS